MSRIAISLSVALLLSACPALCKPPGDQYEPVVPASEPDQQKPSLHRVTLTKTGSHRLTLLPAHKTPLHANNDDVGKVRRPELPAGIDKRAIPNEVTRRKRDLEAELAGADLLEANVEAKRQKRDIETQLNQREFEEDLDSQVELIPEEKERKKRNYIHWLGVGGGTSLYSPPISSFQYHGVPSIAPYNTFNNYHIPSIQSYQVAFPLFGGQLPIFFPPKPILFNPGYPIYNRPRPERPIRPKENETDTPMELPNRFGDPDDLENIDHPVWSVVGESEEVRPTTRRPQVGQRPTKPPTPPLFHRPSFGEEGEGNGSPVNQNDITQEVRPTQSNIQRPTQRPFQPTRGPQTQPPRTTTAAAGRQLDRCVWAIITCCNPSNEGIRYNCFENAGCEGAFWDRSPCSKEVTLEALDAAQQFYESQP